jgi:hypothetical protein
VARPDAVEADDAEEDDGVILDFESEERAKLGKAPPWAHHLHNCMHATKRDVQRVRIKAATRERVVDAKFAELNRSQAEANAKLDRLIGLFGDESEDGAGGKGLVGEVRRQGKRIGSLEGDRNKFWGAMGALTLAAGVVVATLRAWVQSLLHGGGK